MERADTIVKQLGIYSEAYYTGKQLIDDESFDALENELSKIDPDNDYFKKNRESAGYGTKYPHIYEFVGSINKIHTVNESKLIAKPADKFILPINLSAKLDGTSMVAYYKNGLLVHALTRGDGYNGLDVTQHYEAITQKYRLAIPKNFTGAIRGEVIFSIANWEMFKSIHPEAKMARNSGTGLINQKTVQPEASLLDFVTYDMLASTIEISDVFKTLESMGFRTAPNTYPIIMVTETYLKQLFDDWANIYPLDGIVIRQSIEIYKQETKLYTLEKQQEAFKFQAETRLCNITSITWDLGRTGKLIPVIQIEPTELSGAIVTNVTGHNAKVILERKIGANGQITVSRSGEVIPCLGDVIVQVDPTIPTNCPYCNEPLVWSDTKVDLMCLNEDCSGQNYKKMANYLLNVCKDIKGLGDSFIEGFIDFFNAKDILDLLTKINNHNIDTTITTLKRADNLIAKKAIDILTAKSQNLTNFLPALGIKLLGNSYAQEISNSTLAKELLAALTNNDQESVTSILLTILPGKKALAASVAQNIAQISAILRLMESCGQSFSLPSNNAQISAQIRYYAVTGSLSKPRKEFEAELLEKGWKLTETINKAEFLINNDATSNSSKNLKARACNKPIITEEQFYTTYFN